MGLSHSPRIVTNGLQLCLDAGNTRSYPGSGTTWTDLSASRTGTLTNGPTFSGSNGGSINFNGTNSQYVDLNSTFSSVINFSLPLTFEVFAYINLSGNDEVLIGNSFNDGGILLRKTSTNLIRAGFFSTNENYLLLDSGVLSASGWYQTVYTYNGSGASFTNTNLYVNSILSKTLVPGALGAANSIPLNRNLFLGQTGESPFNKYLTGSIAIARIYNRALSAAEISQNFNATRGRYGI